MQRMHKTALLVVACLTFVASCSPTIPGSGSRAQPAVTVTDLADSATSPGSGGAETEPPGTELAPSTTPTEPSTPAEPPNPSFTPIKLPAEFFPSPTLTGPGYVSATSSAPAAIVGVLTTPQLSELAISTSADGVTWSPTTIPVGLPGTPGEPTIAASSSLTAIVGQVNSGGIRSPYLMTSTDRVKWTSIPFPRVVESFESAVLVLDDHIIFSTVDDRSSALWRADGDGITELTSPVSSADLPSVVSIAGHGSNLVTLVWEGPIGDRSAGTYTSIDGGNSWSARAPLDLSQSTMNGLIWADGFYLATGSVTTDASDISVPAAWSSLDGTNWSSDAVKPSSGWNFDNPDYNASFADVSVLDGRATAVANSDWSTFNMIYQRDDAGVWQPIAGSSKGSANGRPGHAFLVGRPGESKVVLAVEQEYGVQIHPEPLTQSSLPISTWGDPQARLTQSSMGGAGQAVDIGVRTRKWAIDASFANLTARDWSYTDHVDYYRWKPETAVEKISDDPAEIAESGQIFRTTDAESGAEVIVAETAAAGSYSVFYRQPGALTWESSGQIGQDGDSISWITKVGGQWLASGSGDPSSVPVVWTSDDARNWVRNDQLGQVAPTATIYSSCALPDGTPLLVGWTGDSPDSIPMAAALIDEAWVLTSFPADATGQIWDCTAMETTTVLPVQLSGNADLYQTSDGLTSDRLTESLPYGHILQITRHKGFLVALFFGRLGGRAGYHLVLSRDGQDWRYFPTPDTATAGQAWLATAGDHLVMSVAPPTGVIEMWEVTGIVEAMR